MALHARKVSVSDNTGDSDGVLRIAQIILSAFTLMVALSPSPYNSYSPIQVVEVMLLKVMCSGLPLRRVSGKDARLG